MTKIVHKPNVQQKRATEYPPLSEFADAYVHQANGNLKPMADYIDKCRAVKRNNPK